MIRRAVRPTITRSTLGERKLPEGGRAIFVLLIAAALGACGAPAAVERTTAPASAASSTPFPTGSGGIPVLGTTPPSGLVLPSYFVALTNSKNGAVGVLTTPGSSCTLSVRTPTGVTREYPAQIVAANGATSFSYPPVAGPGESIQTVRCRLGDQDQSAQGQVIIP